MKVTQAQQHATSAAFVEELTDISGHDLALGNAAMRARQHGFENKGVYRHLHWIGWSNSVQRVIVLLAV